MPVLLSIVECSDYRKWNSDEQQSHVASKSINENIEVIGPVVGANVASMRNAGIERAQGEWVFFKDSDCEVNYETIIDVIQRANQLGESIGAIGGVYQSTGQTTLQRAYHLIQKKWVYSGLSRKTNFGFSEGTHLLGGALLVRKSAYRKTKGFSETIGWGAEETEFIQQLNAKGYQTLVSYSLRVKHNNKLNIAGFFKRAWWQNFNRGRFQVVSREKRKVSSFFYFSAPFELIFPTVLFFTVSQFAYFTGSVFRPISR